VADRIGRSPPPARIGRNRQQCTSGTSGPHRGPATASRSRLVERVRTSVERGPVLLVAEGGYGKTTVLEAAFDDREGARAWVTCTPLERDPGLLLTRLVSALRTAVPGASDVFADRLAAPSRPVDATLAARELLDEVDRLLVDPLTVVVDQAEHVAGAKDALAIVEQLVVAPRSAVRVALATRRPLGIPTARLRARGGLDELGVADLAFDARECAEYLALATGAAAGDEVVAAVLSATEGWPLAVAAVALTLDRGDSVRSLRSPSDVGAFLVEEVLDVLPATKRKAVVDSSVCRYLTAEIAGALGLPAGFLDSIAAAGLFLRRVDGSTTTFTYHPLLRECLLERLAAERGADELAALQRRAATAMTAAGEPVDAIEHHLAAGDWNGAAAALAREGEALMGTSPELVRDWLRRLPREARRAPRMRMLEGQLESFTGDLDAAAELLRSCLDEPSDPATGWLARYRLMEVMYVAGRLDEAVELGAGFETARPEDSTLAAGVGLLAANCLAALGRGKESDAMAAAAARLPGAEASAAMDALRRSHLDVPAGRLDEALREETAELAEVERADPFHTRMSVLGGIAYIVTEQGAPVPALECWRRVEREAEAGLVARNLGPSRAWQALLLVRSGRPGEATRLLAAAGGTEVGWVGYIHDVAGAVVAAARGDREETLAAAERAVECVSPAPALYRVWATGDLVPALVQVGAADRAARVHAETVTLVDDVYPGDAGRFVRARLAALGAWLASARGDETAADDHLLRLFEDPLASAHYVLVREWPRIEPLVWSALERGLLPAGATMQVVVRAFPDGLALVPFVEHPDPTVRRLAIAPAVASGHPNALPLVAGLRDDPEPQVAATARASEKTMAGTRPPRHFTLLGGFSVRRGAWVVDERSWGRPIAARLVRYLLVHAGTRVAEEVLLETFWPDLSVDGARRSLQVAASRVRAALDDPGASHSVLVVADGTYRLELDPTDTVDSGEFEAAATAALATDPPQRGALEHAAALWTGEPLPEERYEDWATTWREHLVDRYAVVLTELTAACERDRDHAGAVDAARRLVELDPFDEAAHRELMVAYARAGRRAAALRQYLECRQVLIDGIGLEPGAASSRLQARILAGDEV
jgi:ATP/maltotriose-dependent transcriptional regulator MalT/DNA-binding SARP family transcriptional activator